MLKKVLKLYSPPHQVKPSFYVAAASFFAIAVLGYLTEYYGHPFLVAPFGATCIILFGLSGSPVSMPINVIGSYFMASVISFMLPHEIWGMALAVSLTLFCMLKFRLTHPPAGGIPILVYYTNPTMVDFTFSVVIGVGVLIVLGEIFKKVMNYEERKHERKRRKSK